MEQRRNPPDNNTAKKGDKTIMKEQETLKQILRGGEIETNENAIIECVKDWLQQKPLDKFPRLNKYPDEATPIELIEYVEKLTDWCAVVEEREFELLEELTMEAENR